MSASLSDLVAQHPVLICAGPGGVGKTTTAAGLGVVSARAGARTLVATIDPAPRLVDALGMETLDATPRALRADIARSLNIDPPELLQAARLDPARVFAGIVEEAIDDEKVRQRIFSNPIYLQITNTLTGTQELAAMLALWELNADENYDRIILDTPPASNALDFFQSPVRITAAVQSPVLRWVTAKKESFFSLKRLSSGGSALLSRLAGLVGNHFMEDLAVFLRDFEPVLPVFVERAAEVGDLFRQDYVATILVTVAERPSIDETVRFAQKLADMQIYPAALVVNRVLTRPKLTDVDALQRHLRVLPEAMRVPDETMNAGIEQLARAAKTLAEASDLQADLCRILAETIPDSPVFQLPMQAIDADGLSVLRRSADAIGAALALD